MILTGPFLRARRLDRGGESANEFERSAARDAGPFAAVGERNVKADSSIVEEVRERAQRISERFGHDLRAYARHLKEIEDRNRSRVVSPVTVVAARRSAKAD